MPLPLPRPLATMMAGPGILRGLPAYRLEGMPRQARHVSAFVLPSSHKRHLSLLQRRQSAARRLRRNNRSGGIRQGQAWPSFLPILRFQLHYGTAQALLPRCPRFLQGTRPSHGHVTGQSPAGIEAHGPAASRRVFRMGRGGLSAGNAARIFSLPSGRQGLKPPLRKNAECARMLPIRRHAQVVRERSAKPLSSVRF